MFKLLIIFIIIYVGACNTIYSYIFGLQSYDNSINNIKEIEKKNNLNIHIVGFIFDPRSELSKDTISNLSKELGKEKIFHLTISPNSLTAKEVLEGKFDNIYKTVFRLIKQQDIKVIFRTMHEMNGGRYPWSGDPDNFKKARIHIRNLSRKEGINKDNILFSFSINHRDMPTQNGSKPHQKAKLTECNIHNKNKYKCLTFEDYYPGSEFVDIIGINFYNRGKGSSNRKRLTPEQILKDPNRNTLERVKQINKPIFIDEVGTTSVKYDGNFNINKSIEIFKNKRDYKNYRLMHLKNFLIKEPDILGFCYFNKDYTNGLQNIQIGESDRAIIYPNGQKTYYGAIDLYKHSNHTKNNEITNLFNTIQIQTKQKTFFVTKKQSYLIHIIMNYINNDKKNKFKEIKKNISQNTKLTKEQIELRNKTIEIIENIIENIIEK